ncbi:MAG: two-component regulator propeller domain-containing protein, partial [Bacteroidota bacterium]
YLWFFQGTSPAESSLRRYDIRKGQWTNQQSTIPALVSTIAFTADGEPWVGTDKGIYRRNNRGEFYRWMPEGVPPDGKVLSIHAGADGMLWIGFANNGLGRIDPEERMFKTLRTGVNDPVFAGYETADGKLLIAAQSGLYRSDSTGMQLERLLGMKVSAVTMDANGNIWAGTDGRGIYILDGNGRVRRNLTTAKDGLSGNNIFHISTEPSGKRVFISTETGLTVVEGQRVFRTMFGQQEDGTGSRLIGNYVIHAQTDSLGNLWVSTNNGINVFDPDLNPVRSINSEADTGRYIRRTIITGTTGGKNGERWISTLSGGVYKLKGQQVENFRSVNGLSSDVAYGVVTDHLGRAWVATTRGISIIDQTSSSIFRLTDDDGLPATDFSLACISKGPSGKIMIGSQQGLVIADPRKFRKPVMNPRVFLESAQVNYNPVPLASDYRLDPSGAAVTFRFSAPVFKNAGQVIYQYRVNGLVDRWVTITADNRVVSLTSLPYRSLVLEMRAGLDPRSIEDSPITRIGIERQPPWWRNPWVYFPFSLAVFGTVVMQIRQRIRRKLEETIRKAELDRSLAAERERLSRDLHDRLGAYAAAIKSNINQLERAEARDAVALDRLKKNAEEMVTALRETIWALKQEKVALTGISDRIKSYVNRISPDFPQVHIQVTEQPGLPHHASPAEAIHLMAIIQEALTNALRHSGCNKIEITFSGDNGFRVSVTDNGQGLTEDPIGGDSGYGLRNMRQRAAESGFLFDISGTNQGTTVTIIQGVLPV